MKNLMLVLFATGLFACTNSRNYAQAVVALVDVSGTYADQKADVVNVIKRGILPKLMPGDSLYVIRIDDESYRKDNVEADLNLDVRPSRANAQKLAFARKLEDFAHRPQRARHTDIRGAMMLGAEYLKETGAGTRTLVVFSDLDRSVRARLRTLSKDNADDLFTAQIAAYQQRIQELDVLDQQLQKQQQATSATSAEWKNLEQKDDTQQKKNVYD